MTRCGEIESSCRTFRVQKDILNYITRYRSTFRAGVSARPPETGFLNQKNLKKKRERGGTSRSEFLNVNAPDIGSE